MTIQDLLRLTLTAGLGGIFLAGFAALIWFGAASEFKTRRQFQKLGGENRRKKEKQGTWVCASSGDGLENQGEGSAGDILFVKDGTLVKGFARPEGGNNVKRSTFQTEKAVPEIE